MYSRIKVNVTTFDLMVTLVAFLVIQFKLFLKMVQQSISVLEIDMNFKLRIKIFSLS